MIRSSSSIGIGIATKDRWDDLAITLAHLQDEGLSGLETIVIDDGSRSPIPTTLREKFPWAQFIRFEESQGYIVQRNRVASLLTTEFYLSLDDDSFPVAGDLEAAATWLREHPKVAALALSIVMAGEPIPTKLDREPARVRDFIGCAFMLRRDLFLSLGGFETRLHFYHEEPEYCFRTFQHDYDTYAYPGVVIRHNKSPVSRENGRRTRFFMRNIVLLDLWFYPHPKSWVRALGHGPLIFLRMPQLRRHWWPLLRGWVEGFFYYLSWGKTKQRLTAQQFAERETLPVAVHLCMGSNTPV